MTKPQEIWYNVKIVKIDNLFSELYLVIDYEIIETNGSEYPYSMLLWAKEGELPDGVRQLVVPLEENGDDYIDYITRTVGAQLFLNEFTSGKTYQRAVV